MQLTACFEPYSISSDSYSLAEQNRVCIPSSDASALSAGRCAAQRDLSNNGAHSKNVVSQDLRI